MKNKEVPVQIEMGEWLYKGCFIQEFEHPKLVGKFEVFKNDKTQTHVGRCFTFTEAKKLCEENECSENVFNLLNMDYTEINKILIMLSQHKEVSEEFSNLKEKFFEHFSTYKEVHQLTIIMRETEKYENDKILPFYLKNIFSDNRINNLLK